LATQIALLIFPFFAFVLFTMLLWIRNLAGRIIPMWLKIAYWAIQCALFFYMAIHKFIIQDDRNASPDQLWTAIHYAEVIILFAIIIHMLFLPEKIKNNRKKRFLRSIGLIYFVSFGIFEAYQQFSMHFLEESSLTYFSIAGGLYFCINIPALIYIFRFLSRYHHEMVELPISGDDMDPFCIAHSITPREKEIVGMITTGKSNREIGQHLHISVQTVKNINTNIYKKTGTKNRIQLLNQILEFGKEIRDKR
jgi:DNA-binding CsgD family transcriptional regulator